MLKALALGLILSSLACATARPRIGSVVVADEPKVVVVGPARGHASDSLDRSVTLYVVARETRDDFDCMAEGVVVDPHRFEVPAGSVLCAEASGQREIVFHVR